MYKEDLKPYFGKSEPAVPLECAIKPACCSLAHNEHLRRVKYESNCPSILLPQIAGKSIKSKNYLIMGEHYGVNTNSGCKNPNAELRSDPLIPYLRSPWKKCSLL